jgi:hypothetical protein
LDDCECYAVGDQPNLVLFNVETALGPLNIGSLNDVLVIYLRKLYDFFRHIPFYYRGSFGSFQQGLRRYRFADGGDRLQMWGVAANLLNKKW